MKDHRVRAILVATLCLGLGLPFLPSVASADMSENLALNRTYTATCQRSAVSSQIGAAFDGSMSSYYLAPDVNSGGWHVEDKCKPLSVTID
ncbi:MAG: hypothetical protein LBV00_12035, partial [Propionibacteriaceae bacterium]|nr:hypothetical protein [Propionibacteriaceae bacterium]